MAIYPKGRRVRTAGDHFNSYVWITKWAAELFMYWCFLDFSLSYTLCAVCSLCPTLPARLFLSASPRTLFQYILNAVRWKQCHSAVVAFTVMNWVILMAYWWCSLSFSIDLFVIVFVLLFINSNSNGTNDLFRMFQLAKSDSSQRTKTAEMVDGVAVD